MSAASRIPRPLADATLLETWEVCWHLAKSQRAVHELIQRGLLRAVGAHRGRRIAAQSVRDYIREGGAPAQKTSSHLVSGTQRVAGRFAASSPNGGIRLKHRWDKSADAPAEAPATEEGSK